MNKNHSGLPQFVPALDGMRAISVLMVVLAHAGFPSLPFFETFPGWIGVDLFFVISGFLITHLLLRERENHNEINLKLFWIRRFLRLMPAYYFYVSFLIVLMLLMPESLYSDGEGFPILYVASLLGYFVNFINETTIWEYADLSLHLWSLALEEQFYLVWPVLLFFIAKHRRLLLVVGALLLLATSTFTYVFPDHVSTSYHLWGRGASILSGCLAGIIGFSMSGGGRNFLVRWSKWAWLFCIGFVVALTINENSTVGLHRNFFIVPISISCSIGLIYLWYSPLRTSPVIRTLSWAPLVSIGRISYGVYLYHMVVQVIVWSELTSFLDNLGPRAVVYGIRLATTVALSIGVAWISYQYLEKPFLEMKSRFRQERS